jgi:penicillin amidase
MGGDGDTPHQANFRLGDPFDVAELSVARYVFDLSDWDKSAWVIPLGSSGHPGSPHYADQTRIWADVKLIPMLYEWDIIAAEAESRQELQRV